MIVAQGGWAVGAGAGGRAQAGGSIDRSHPVTE